MVTALSLSFWLEEASAVEPAPLSWRDGHQALPTPEEEVGSRFQAAWEPVAGFMLIQALPQPRAAYDARRPTA